MAEKFKTRRAHAAIFAELRTETLSINELSEAGWDWYQTFSRRSTPRTSTDRYSSFLAEDVELIVNNAEAVRGREQVAAGLAGYGQSFGTLEHELLAILGSDRAFALEALNHYTTLDGRAVTLRAGALTDRREDGLATSVRLYSDTAPLFAA